MASLAPEAEGDPVSGKNLLVVEDESHNRSLLSAMPREDGHRLEMSENGDEAWQKLLEQPYDCIIMDLKMPVLDGVHLYRRIEDYDPELASRVIFITGDTISPYTSEFVAKSANPVPSKPFSISLLRQEIRKILEVEDWQEQTR